MIKAVFETYYKLSTLGLQLDPAIVLVNPVWFIIGPALLVIYFLMINSKVGNWKISLVPVVYAPLFEGIISANSQLAFMPVLFILYQQWQRGDYNKAILTSALSCFIRPDGILLFLLSGLYALRSGKLKGRYLVTGGMIIITYLAVDSLLLGQPAYHLLINLQGGEIFNWSVFPLRLVNEPFTLLHTLVTLPLILHYALKDNKFRPYYCALLLFGLFKPFMFFEIGRWAGSGALMLFVLQNKEAVGKYIRPILFTELIVTAAFMLSVFKYMLTLL